MPEIEYGNLHGRYFTQWRIDLLKELLQYVERGLSFEPKTVAIQNVRIWYDEHEDFHNLSFTSNGHVIEVRFYKVFSSRIDGESGWVGCPRGEIIEFANHLRRKVGQCTNTGVTNEQRE